MSAGFESIASEPRGPAYPWPVPGNERRPTPPLSGEVRADVAIVGGGFSGLSAAYHLIRERPERSVVLLEAGWIASGASGRNTGMAGPGVQNTIVGLRKRYGDVVAAQMFGATLDAVETAVDLVRDEKLDPDLEVTGQLKVATTRWQATSLRKQARAFAELGFDVPFLEAPEVAASIASPRYPGALFFRRGALVNPARVCERLKGVLLDANVQVFEHSPVRAISPGRLVRLELDEGHVLADQVVVATNGYTAGLGMLQGKVWPLHTQILETEPLTGDEFRALGWYGREAIIDSRNFFNYFRRTPEGRIILGGGRVFYRRALRDRHTGGVDLENPRAYRALQSELEGLFPSLPSLRISRYWSGTMGMTIDQLPMICRPASRVLYVGAWCGHGIALALASGALVADLLAGRRADRTMVPWVRETAPRLPPDPVRSLGLSVYTRGLHFADRLGEMVETLKPRQRELPRSNER